MRTCEEIRPLLPAYAAGTLEEETALQMVDHLLLCPICAAELEALRAEQYRPSAMRPMGLPRTKPPEIKKEASTAEERPEAMEDAPAPAEEALPEKKSRLSRRGRMILALVLLVAVVGTILALLISRDVFSIRDRMHSADKFWTAVMYKGAEAGEETGFRIRLWTDGDWERETVFRGSEYKRMVWSPNGRFVAVEFLDRNGQSSIYVMDTQRQREGNVFSVLESYLSKHEGLFGNVFLAGVPSCSILQWLPDSSALLIAAEGTVDTNIDPNYGIEFAQSGSGNSNWVEFSLDKWDHIEFDTYSGSSTAQPRDSADSPTVSGYFAYLPESAEIQNVTGFGIQSQADRLLELQLLNAHFQNQFVWGATPGLVDADVFVGTALLELAQLPDTCMLEVYVYQEGPEDPLNPGQIFTLLGTGRQVLGQVSAENDLVLNVTLDQSRAWLLVIPS